MKHAAHAQECPLDSFHFAIVEGGQRPFFKAGTIQGSRLIDDDLAVLQQAVAGGDGNAPLFESGINLRCQRQDDDHRCADRGQRIVLKNQNRTDFAGFLPARRITSTIFREIRLLANRRISGLQYSPACRFRWAETLRKWSALLAGRFRLSTLRGLLPGVDP